MRVVCNKIDRRETERDDDETKIVIELESQGNSSCAYLMLVSCSHSVKSCK